MRLEVVPDAEALGRAAAREVAAAILARPELVLALPTGRTPAGMYAELVRIHQEENLEFSRLSVFSLDEYLGIPPEDPRSFHSYLWTCLLSQVNVRPERVFLASSSADESFCKNYEKAVLDAGGIDLLIAGVGTNGHIAFNEPGAPPDSRTRIVKLSEATISQLRHSFPPESGTAVPDQAVTIGIATILEARNILLLAAGRHKRVPLRGLIDGPVSTSNPVSALRVHPKLTVIADQAAI